MNSKIILKIIIILFILLLFSYNTAFATEIDERLEMFYEEVETEDGIFYKRKKHDKSKATLGYSVTLLKDDEPTIEIIKDTTDEYVKKYTLENCPIEQRIEKEYYQSILSIYSTTEGYKNKEDIKALISINATPVDGTSNYWKENFTNNELYYNEYVKKYYLTVYYFVRLSFNEESNKYELAYIDFKPENLEEEISRLKEKGLDIENIDVKELMKINYDDQIVAIPGTETSSISAEKTEYNSKQIEEISNTAQIIRTVCISLIIVVVFAGIIQVWRKNNY